MGMSREDRPVTKKELDERIKDFEVATSIKLGLLDKRIRELEKRAGIQSPEPGQLGKIR